jgi:hypothetical protein
VPSESRFARRERRRFINILSFAISRPVPEAAKQTKCRGTWENIGQKRGDAFTKEDSSNRRIGYQVSRASGIFPKSADPFEEKRVNREGKGLF